VSEVIRAAAKIIFKDSLSGKQLCPGEDNCLKFETAANEQVCEACPKNLSKTKLYGLEDIHVILPWITHLFYLYSLLKLGVSFRIDDLTKKEWDGLLMLESVKAEVEHEQYEAERLKHKAAAELAKGKRR